MSGLLGVDAGQTGIRVRWTGDGPPVEAGYPGILTDRPLMPQLAGVVRSFLAGHDVAPTRVGVGSSGLITPEASELRGLLEGTGITDVAVAHDATTSYLGALGDRPGAVIAVGTGVVTLAVGPATVARVDGWGYLIGDAGSAFWIGRRGMEAALRAFDGRGEATVLLDRMRELFPDPAAAYVELQSDERKVSRIASFARTVDAAAAAGDHVAEGIVEAAAAELSESVLAGLRRVELMDAGTPAVCALGKVLSSVAIRERFVGYLRLHWPELELLPPAGTALDGAALAATLAHDSPLSALVARAS